MNNNMNKINTAENSTGNITGNTTENIFTPPKSTKQIYDPIHEFINITPLMQKIIDTPEFQRLRDLKQLGATYFVYPSATHSRFAHSLGVSHLAGLMMETLQKNQPRLLIGEREIEITRIAGLLHDLGHGPFSHLYDDYIRTSGEPDHEKRGCLLFRNMVSKYNLPIEQQEVEQICLMIDPTDEVKKHWPYQIVANKICQIDVDKMDYIRRDCYHLGIEMTGSFSRIINSVRVVKTKNGNEVLAWPKKLQFNIFNLFATRYKLHKQVYHHHAVKAHEFIITDILKKLRTKYGKQCWQLTDSSVMCSLHKEYNHLIRKLQTRDIPKLVGEITVTLPNKGYDELEPNPRLVFNNIFQTSKIGFSSGGRNPLNDVYYYRKTNKDFAEKLNPQHSSFCIPSQHQELLVRMYTIGKLSDAEEDWFYFAKRFKS